MFVVSVILLVASIAVTAFFGLNFGVDFRGGSVLELSFDNGRPAVSEILNKLNETNLTSDISVNPAGDKGAIIRSRELTENEHQQLLSMLNSSFTGSGLKELKFDSVGPTVGKELKRKSITAIIILLIAVLLYIAFVFRKLSRSLSLWAMAGGTIVGLLHDIMIPLGVFALLGKYFGVQITAVYVAAILTVLGYTVSDKVVIYDRVRENILRGMREPLPDIVHKSVMQTLMRSINNTLTVMLSSAAIFFFGGESIRYFALALMLGVGLGAYSSIFVASPILVWWGRGRK